MLFHTAGNLILGMFLIFFFQVRLLVSPLVPTESILSSGIYNFKSRIYLPEHLSGFRHWYVFELSYCMAKLALPLPSSPAYSSFCATTFLGVHVCMYVLIPVSRFQICRRPSCLRVLYPVLIILLCISRAMF